MRHARILLSLALVVVWLRSGVGPASPPWAAGDSVGQPVGPDQVPTGLTPAAWQRIQAQVAKLTAADGAAWDEFGYSASVSADTAAVGAGGAGGGDAYQGAVYIFYRNQGGPGAWGQVAKLTAGGGAGEWFGCSVSLNGDTAVVGELWADVGGNTNQGVAHVFYRDQGGPDAWGQVAKLTAADGAAYDLFGYSVSVSGDTAVVGASSADVGGNLYQGAAYIFYRNRGGPGAWGQVVKLVAADGAADNYFGVSVSVSGDTALVGAEWADVGGIAQGAAYVFHRNQGGADAWSQVAKLTATDGEEGDIFGTSVSLSGDMAVVGARGADVGDNLRQGAAYVFYRNQGARDAWGQVAKLTAADGVGFDRFGVSASVSGDTAVVGAWHAEVGGNTWQGAAYVYSLGLAQHTVYLPLVSQNYAP